MQLRVTCPACQTPLGVSAGHGDGTILRCPRCRHEFALKVRPQCPPPTVQGLSAHDQPSHLPSSYIEPLRPRVRPPRRSNASGGGTRNGRSFLRVFLFGGVYAVLFVVVAGIVVSLIGPLLFPRGNPEAVGAAAFVIAFPLCVLAGFALAWHRRKK